MAQLALERAEVNLTFPGRYGWLETELWVRPGYFSSGSNPGGVIFLPDEV
jgi:hypothetical protein